MIESPAPGMPTAALWLSLYGCISIPFLKHFSSAIGNDLGHETAQKMIEVLVKPIAIPKALALGPPRA